MSTWLKSAVFYEIYPNSFMDSDGDGYGDFKGIISKLDYIKELGCDAIWLNPHYDSPFRDGGYDVRDHKKTSPRFGSEDDFKDFIESAHAKGLKVIIDLVSGHTSDECPDFIESAKNTANQMYDRFIWTDDVWKRADGYNTVSGMYNRNGGYVVNFFAMQPALNYGFNRIDDPAWQMPYTSEAALKTREWLKDVMRFWFDRDVDGFRVDMADSLVKNDGGPSEKPATSEIWADIRAMLDEQYPDKVLVSEWSNPQAINAGFHADFMLNHEGNPYNTLVRGKDCYFSGNGDAQKFAQGFSEWYEKIKGKGHIGLITCNHDTPRLAPEYSEEQLKVIYATLFLLPGVPFIYYGDEIGMKYKSGLPSVEGGFSRTGSRTPMQWTAGVNGGFSTAQSTFLPVDSDKVINVESAKKNKKSLYNFIKSLLAFRAANKQFISADFEILHAVGSEPLVFSRGDRVVVVNPRTVKQTVTVNAKLAKPLFSAGKEAKAGKPTANGVSVSVPPLSVTVF